MQVKVIIENIGGKKD